MKNKFIFSFLLVALISISHAQITVSDNHRFLQNKDGKPFFWLGDTDVSKISGAIKNSWWFDPRTGKALKGEVVKNKKHTTIYTS